MSDLKTMLVTGAASVLAEIETLAHKAEAVVETVFVSETQKLVAIVKDSDIGTRAMNLLSAIEDKTLSGAEKAATILSDVTGDLHALDAAGGLKGLAVTVEGFAQEFVLSAVNDFEAAAKATGL